jgi:hypothetical protein
MMGGVGSTRNDDMRGDDVSDTEGGGIDYGKHCIVAQGRFVRPALRSAVVGAVEILD